MKKRTNLPPAPCAGGFLLTPPYKSSSIAPRSCSSFCFMARSIKKGPYIDFKLQKKVEGKKPEEVGVIKTWARASQISPEMVGFTIGVHNGKEHINVLITDDMVGHRLGEFSQTKKFVRHGGKMAKELDQKKREAEIAAAKAAKAAA